MEEALLSRIVGADTVKALIGDKVQWGVREGDACIALHLIGDEPDYHHGGRSGLSAARVQADCWGLTWLDVKALGAALEGALPGQGLVVGDVRFDACLVLSRDIGRFGDAPNILFRNRLDLRVRHATA